MLCPMYNNYERDCVRMSKELAHVFSFEYCKSERYKECPFYKVTNGEVIPCRFIWLCNEKQKYGKLDMERIILGANTYCFSDNHVNCEIFKLRNASEDVPKNLTPDGSNY